MKKSKRFFAAMMAAAMTAGMLTGCGGGAKKESSWLQGKPEFYHVP